MGNYNPYLPQILGQEWVGIRDEDYVLNPFANSLERGYSFTLPTATTINSVRFYLKEWPNNFGSSMIYTASIYPQGQEASSGPIKSVIIPTNSVAISGSSITQISGAATQDLFANGDNEFLQWIMGQGVASPVGVSVFFNTTAYAQLLFGKRILGVDLLVGINVVDQGTEVDAIFQAIQMFIANDGFDAINTPDTFRLPDLITNRTPASTIGTVRVHLGDANRYFGVGSGTTAGINMINQWSYPELARFEASAANRLRLLLLEGPGSPAANLGPQVQIEYAAMEVFYCEEARVLAGSRIFNDDVPNRPLRDPFTLGANTINVRTQTSFTGGSSLAAGNYTLTLGESNMGDNYYASIYRTTAKLNEVRQLYTIPTVLGRQINLPTPLNDAVIDTTFTSESTDLIPQLTMHATNGSVIDYSHVYGQQSVGQVWGTQTVSQIIDDRFAGGARTFPWVRYYARRFGSTTTPLKLRGPFPSTGLLLPGTAGNYASTPDTAALDIVGDIDMRVDMTPTSWTPASTSALMGKWSGAPNRSYLFNLTTTGLLELAWSADGSATIVKDSTVAVPVTSGRLVVRATLDVNNGAAGNDVTFYTGPTLNGPWTQLGAVVTTAGVTSIFATATNVEIGSNSNGTLSLWPGYVHGARIYNGIGGTAVATPIFEIQPPGTTVFTDSVGRVWTVNGTASISAGDNSNNAVASITPAEFDALDEITDGWKEVTLQFPTAPSMGGSEALPLYTWSAAGEAAGNRWEVLGVTAPAVSGFAFTSFNTPTFNQVPTSQQLWSATYGSPVSGGVVLETWMPQWGPYVSGAASDRASDVSIMFSQAAPAVTGFSLTMGSQAISGIGLDCGLAPCGIPTHILYNQLSWSYPTNTGFARDSFTRSVVNGLGTADVGGAYSLTQAAVNYQVNGSEALINSPSGSLGVLTIGTLANIGTDFDITVTTWVPGGITGSSARGSAIGRFTDANNYYEGLVQSTTTTGINIVGISRTVGGAGTVISTANIFPPINNTTKLNLRFVGQGQYLKIKAWSIYTDEPDNWQIELTDSNLTTGTGAGIAARTLDTRDVVAFDNLSITPPRYWFDYYEMQRSDEITDWQTIMKATNPATISFKDYEARIGLRSNYRIRTVNQYGFPGDWSSTVSIVPPAPGVSGGCLSDAHIMVFSTNERQDGSSNLAYSNAWESTVIEGFTFPEAGFTQLQPMYDRDFFTAFRPRERGGEQFTRELLVQAAAIAPETLGDFRSLRDMAWDDVSYICVRDEDGNRWFASVNVPTGTVQNFRKLYLAAIQIVEVTDTPSPADPSS